MGGEPMAIETTVALIAFIGVLLNILVTFIWNTYSLGKVRENQEKLLQLQTTLEQQSTRKGYYYEWRAKLFDNLINWLHKGSTLAIQLITLNDHINDLESVNASEDRLVEPKQAQADLNSDLSFWELEGSYFIQVFSNMREFKDSNAFILLHKHINSLLPSHYTSAEKFFKDYYPDAVKSQVKLIEIIDELFSEN